MVFFRDYRIGHVLKQIEGKRGDGAAELLELGKRVQDEVCPALLSNFAPPAMPVILHGDLWSGNVRTNSDTGEPIIFDCSSYYGHHEADFGISHMFGSNPPDLLLGPEVGLIDLPAFDDRFYDTYHQILPKSQPHYDERMQLYELYHHLNHYLLVSLDHTYACRR